MENHKSTLLLKLSRLFPSSLSFDCQSRAAPDVAHTSIVITKSKKIPKPENTCSDAEGRKCSPVAPFSTTTVHPKPKTTEGAKNRSSSSNSGQWFTSSEERTRAAAEGFETDTFYSLSSNSGDSSHPKTTSRKPATRRHEEMEMIDETGSDHASTRTYYDSGYRRRRSGRKSTEEGLAVERRSSDPYSDFMASMVEMIIQKQMFEAEDLDRMLSRFLALNEVEYHGIIFHVFSEICQTLFCD